MLRRAGRAIIGLGVTSIAIGLSSPLRLRAQEATKAVAGLRPGQFVRVRTRDGRQVAGRIAAVTQDPPSIELSDHSSIPLASADSLWTRGSDAGRDALIGAGVLGATSLLVASQTCSSGGGEPVCEGVVVIGAGAAGALLGAFVGGFLGSYVTRWNLVFTGSPSKLGLGLSLSL